jgi:hypothetical protein
VPLKEAVDLRGQRESWKSGALTPEMGTVRWKQMQNNIHVPDELLAELHAKAAVEGKSVDEVATEALRMGLEDRSWRNLLEYGRQKGLESGYTEADVPGIVKQWRGEHRR